MEQRKSEHRVRCPAGERLILRKQGAGVGLTDPCDIITENFVLEAAQSQSFPPATLGAGPVGSQQFECKGTALI